MRLDGALTTPFLPSLDRVLDLRDLLPKLKAVIGEQYRLKNSELDRDMNMTQTLDCTVEFLEDLLKEYDNE